MSLELFDLNGKVALVTKGEDFNTIRIYEDTPTLDSVPIYRYGANMCFALKEKLQKDTLYTFSIMIQLNDASSFGLDYLGFHALTNFPTNQKNKIWDRIPEQVIPIKDLNTNIGWVEKQISFKANGGEQFLVIGAVYPNYTLSKNHNFQRKVSHICGPDFHPCIDENIIYRDSFIFVWFIF